VTAAVVTRFAAGFAAAPSDIPRHPHAMTLHVAHLSKTYANGVRALQDISLTIAPGMFGLLGPNGAGKSTLMRTLATLQTPDSGRMQFRDIDVQAQPDRLRALLGYLPQDFGLYPAMPADAILDHFATLKGVVARDERRERVDALLHQVNLYEVRKQPVGGFSGGMKQRLGIAIALAGRPKLLIVDEPTAGLDPSERQRFLNLLADIGDDVVVILSTHLVQDVRALCTQMAIIDAGRIIVQGAPESLLDTMRGCVWRCTVPRASLNDVQARHRVISSKLVGGRMLLHIFSEQSPGNGFAPIEPDLEDFYFHQLALSRDVRTSGEASATAG
jgi:ABC-type multidrug transport system ATPase subunit